MNDSSKQKQNGKLFINLILFVLYVYIHNICITSNNLKHVCRLCRALILDMILLFSNFQVVLSSRTSYIACSELAWKTSKRRTSTYSKLHGSRLLQLNFCSIIRLLRPIRLPNLVR